jgi:hypothetical protein
MKKTPKRNDNTYIDSAFATASHCQKKQSAWRKRNKKQKQKTPTNLAIFVTSFNSESSTLPLPCALIIPTALSQASFNRQFIPILTAFPINILGSKSISIPTPIPIPTLGTPDSLKLVLQRERIKRH